MTDEVFDNAPCGYFSYYDDGTIYQVNRTCSTLLGYEKKELEGENLERIFTIATRIFCQTHFFPLVKLHGHAGEIFFTMLAKNGSHLPVLVNAKREEQQRPYTACAFITVPNRKKFEEELIIARNEAETALRENTLLLKAKADLQKHTEKLDTQIQIVNKQNHELKQLNHVITHSLKEPLRKILLFTEKLGMYQLPQDAMTTFSRLTKSSEQMRKIVVGLQQYIWLNDTPSNFSGVALENVIRQAEAQIKKETAPDQLQVEISSLPPFIEADERQLELLFYHLLSNAVKFKKENKVHVKITASLVQQNRFKSIEGKYQYEDFVKLEFSDNGIGFDPAQASEVFDLFKKLHFNEGVGLGLALCKKIIENHSGTIRAESGLDKGTVMIMMLPVAQSFKAGTPAEADSGRHS